MDQSLKNEINSKFKSNDKVKIVGLQKDVFLNDLIGTVLSYKEKFGKYIVEVRSKKYKILEEHLVLIEEDELPVPDEVSYPKVSDDLLIQKFPKVTDINIVSANVHLKSELARAQSELARAHNHIKGLEARFSPLVHYNYQIQHALHAERYNGYMHRMYAQAHFGAISNQINPKELIAEHERTCNDLQKSLSEALKKAAFEENQRCEMEEFLKVTLQNLESMTRAKEEAESSADAIAEDYKKLLTTCNESKPESGMKTNATLEAAYKAMQKEVDLSKKISAKGSETFKKVCSERDSAREYLKLSNEQLEKKSSDLDILSGAYNELSKSYSSVTEEKEKLEIALKKAHSPVICHHDGAQIRAIQKQEEAAKNKEREVEKLKEATTKAEAAKVNADEAQVRYAAETAEAKALCAAETAEAKSRFESETAKSKARYASDFNKSLSSLKCLEDKYEEIRDEVENSKVFTKKGSLGNLLQLFRNSRTTDQDIFKFLVDNKTIIRNGLEIHEKDMALNCKDVILGVPSKLLFSCHSLEDGDIVTEDGQLLDTNCINDTLESKGINVESVVLTNDKGFYLVTVKNHSDVAKMMQLNKMQFGDIEGNLIKVILIQSSNTDVDEITCAISSKPDTSVANRSVAYLPFKL